MGLDFIRGEMASAIAFFGVGATRSYLRLTTWFFTPLGCYLLMTYIFLMALKLIILFD
jgi:hypothetical protein